MTDDFATKDRKNLTTTSRDSGRSALEWKANIYGYQTRVFSASYLPPIFVVRDKIWNEEINEFQW